MDGTLTIIGSIIGSIILSILGNLLTDPLKRWLDRRTSVNKSKRVETLEKDLSFIRELNADKQKLNTELLIATLRGSFLFFVGIAGGMVGTAYLVMMIPSKTVSALRYSPFTNNSEWVMWYVFGIVSALGGAVFIVIATRIFLVAMRLQSNVHKFSDFEKDTMNRIKELKKSKKGNAN